MAHEQLFAGVFFCAPEHQQQQVNVLCCALISPALLFSLADWLLTNELTRTRFILVSCIPRPQNKEAPPASIASGSLEPWNFSRGDKRILIYKCRYLIHLSAGRFDPSLMKNNQCQRVDVCFSSSVGRGADSFQNCPPQKQLLSDCACVKHSRRKHALFGVRHLCRPATADLFFLSRSLSRWGGSFFFFFAVCANGELIDQTLWYFYIVNLAIIFCRKGVKIHRRGVDDRLLSASFLPPARRETCAPLNYL